MRKNVVVIGAGIVGSAIAYYLSRKGVDVTVIEKEQPASGATGKSFGWINANFPDNPDYYRLRLASIHEYHDLSARLEGDSGLTWGGSLWWESQGNDFDAHLNDLSDLEYDLEELSPGQFSKLESLIASPPEQSIRFPLEGSAEPRVLTNALLKSAKINGIDVMTGCELLGFKRTANRVIGIETTLGDFECDLTVVAAGCQTRSLLASTNVQLPMDNRKGILAHTVPVEPLVQHIMLAPDIHFRQQQDGRFLIGEDYSGSSEPTEDFLLKRLQDHLPGIQGLEIDGMSDGYRPMPADGYPVIGTPVGIDGLYIASMHSGITLAPIIGKLASAEILTSSREAMLEPFRVERFS